ncbi:hypothetical protein [Streptomyces sp. NPDC001508]|uniref:hypothetical protein n=1 Tax=Streptomyces sp. NPDC001508 TaxID=3154656 RepID=UPI00331B1AAC
MQVPPALPADTFFEVTGESSLQAAARPAAAPVAVLNIASALPSSSQLSSSRGYPHPGGGYLNGAQPGERRAGRRMACGPRRRPCAALWTLPRRWRAPSTPCSAPAGDSPGTGEHVVYAVLDRTPEAVVRNAFVRPSGVSQCQP